MGLYASVERTMSDQIQVRRKVEKWGREREREKESAGVKMVLGV